MIKGRALISLYKVTMTHVLHYSSPPLIRPPYLPLKLVVATLIREVTYGRRHK